MTDNEQLETQAATEQEIEPSEAEGLAMEQNKQVEAETNQQPTQPDPKDEEIARLAAELKRKDDRLAAYKGDKKLITNMVKGIMDEYGLTYEEAVKHAGNINPNDLKARLESADVADNPFEVQAQAFNNLYVNAGVKDTLDEVYGENTQTYVDAFSKAVRFDENIAAEFSSMDATKLPAYVVKKGKEFLQKQKATETLADENARLKAELEALKAGKSDEPEVTQRKTLPLSGVPSAGIGQPAVDARFRSFV
jgi:hypothetical protein